MVSPLTTGETAADNAYLTLSVLDPANSNLTNTQKELMLLWHFKLGNFHLEWVQQLFHVQEGESELTLLSHHKVNTCQLPQCAACDFAKMHLRLTESVLEKKVIRKNGSLKSQHLHPGDMVSTDQYVLKETGWLPHTHGKESKSE